MNASRTIELKDLYSEVVSAEEFIRIFNEERETIEQVEIIPPKLGERAFGRLRVTRKYPVARIDWDKLTKNER